MKIGVLVTENWSSYDGFARFVIKSWTL